MKKRKFISLICALSAACAVFTVGCVSGGNDSAEDLVYSLYQSYAETAEATGSAALTYEEWLLSIKGEKGEDGENGNNGSDGKSAYKIWLEAGHNGSEEDFIAFLKGEKGDSGENGADGVSVIGAYINDETHLILQMSDNTEIDAGYVGVSVSPEEQPEEQPEEPSDNDPEEQPEEPSEGDPEEPSEGDPEEPSEGDSEEQPENDPEEQPDDSENSGNITVSEELYVINIQSTGGLKLNGVTISVINADGEVVLSRTSSDGQIKDYLKPGEYTVKINALTLPDGYYMEEDVTYTVGGSGNYELTITVPSAIISAPSEEEKTYNVGDIAGEFTLTDYTGVTYSLSEILQEKRAVIITFWDPKASSDSKSQLSVLQDIYSEFSADVEILGVYGNNYTRYQIDSFMGSSELNITFPLAADGAGLTDSYQISELPTTVIIDRYGLIVNSLSGAQTDFKELSTILQQITAESYQQKLS